ncbi:endonuclease III [Candidatus Levyibacteriota bacterium]|nr:endonuclease III [Candidatus Levybacteria bacterium]MSU26144.1 endonuclease III [Candidatus Levybacteria bacterium]GDX62241.1 endonuclease III [Candidatus Levybacteria bacterium]
MNPISSGESGKIFSLLKNEYGFPKTILNFSNEWELMVAVMLSAQCTDIMVNNVTSKLFNKYKSINEYADANILEFEQDIRSTGFYRNKTKNIISTAKLINNHFGGNLPRSINEMLKLPGVARKTANVVLGNAFQIFEGIAVDTHVKRLSIRLGLSSRSDPEKIELDLMKLFNKKDWFQLTYLLIDHGRKICNAKKPKCDKCILNKLCPSAFNFSHFQKKE